MTSPKRGMVAGQPITTGAQTQEFDEGYERIFGKDRKPVRGRFIYDAEAGEVVPVGADWTDTERRAQTVTEEIVYGNLVATDGTRIDTRKKNREYKKAHGLADMSDYKNHWEKAEKKRADFYQGRGFDQGMNETIGRAMHAAKNKRRR